MDKLTFTMENYLEAIYELSPEGDGARVTDIAERLGVTKASTNSAMCTLSEKGLIVNEKYKEVYLTAEGLRIAQLTANKHHIIQQFLIHVLKIDAAVANEDACAIEHVISSTSVSAMEAFLKTL
ncbi:metal-dependent transcriptional regulator [Oscillospiraceae bacterium CM]|nr:metal-dependent transcriptional regulator [Oscillospiraceae bacterium CM]